jgi:hypothetical protein
MWWAEHMSDLKSEWSVLREPEHGSVLHFVFHGHHHWTHGPKMFGYVEEIARRENPSGIVLDLTDYEYEFGNDVGCLFMVGFDRSSRASCPVVILAEGRTRAALGTLFEDSGFGRLGRVGFRTTLQAALEWLRSGDARGPA